MIKTTHINSLNKTLENVHKKVFQSKRLTVLLRTSCLKPDRMSMYILKLSCTCLPVTSALSGTNFTRL